MRSLFLFPNDFRAQKSSWRFRTMSELSMVFQAALFRRRFADGVIRGSEYAALPVAPGARCPASSITSGGCGTFTQQGHQKPSFAPGRLCILTRRTLKRARWVVAPFVAAREHKRLDPRTSAVLALLGPEGGLACIAGIPDLSVVPDLPYSISIHDIGPGGVLASPAFRRRQEDLGRMATELMALVQDGKIRPTVAEQITLETIPKALERLAERHARGKIVARVQN